MYVYKTYLESIYLSMSVIWHYNKSKRDLIIEFLPEKLSSFTKNLEFYPQKPKLHEVVVNYFLFFNIYAYKIIHIHEMVFVALHKHTVYPSQGNCVFKNMIFFDRETSLIPSCNR